MLEHVVIGTGSRGIGGYLAVTSCHAYPWPFQLRNSDLVCSSPATQSVTRWGKVTIGHIADRFGVIRATLKPSHGGHLWVLRAFGNIQTGDLAARVCSRR